MGIYLKHKGRFINQIFKYMPKFDGTGPRGYGPRTGRGLGSCGCGLGYGGCYGRRFFTKKEEKDFLQEEIEELKKELEAAKERLTEIKEQK